MPTLLPPPPSLAHPHHHSTTTTPCHPILSLTHSPPPLSTPPQVHADSSTATPLKLQQAVTVCAAHEKLDVLWSFLKAHLKSKVIVFLSTCKQVRFVFEAFR